MRIELRLIGYGLVLISMVCVYVAFMCYTQVVRYQEQIVHQNKRIDEATTKWATLNEEDLILLQRIEDQNKRIREQDDRIRVQDALITEMRTRVKRK